MERFKVIKNPDITVFDAVRIDKDTELEYKSDYVKQTIKKLKLHSVTTLKGKGYKSKYVTTIDLNEGDVVVFDGETRGYVKPVEKLVTIDEAIEDLKSIKGV